MLKYSPSMAPEVYDSRRDITLTLVDGSRKTETLMETTFDPQSMEMHTENDMTGMKYEIYAEIGQNYQTQKTETREDLKEMINGLPPGDPIRSIMMLEYISMMPGYDFEDMRDYARMELIKSGIKKPETEEELQSHATNPAATTTAAGPQLACWHRLNSSRDRLT